MDKKAIIWLRVSTKKQDLTQQKKDLTEFAKSEGYSEKDLIYIEGLGASAIKQDDLYEEIMEELKQKLKTEPVSVIYCWEISRLARDKERFEGLKKILVAKKIQLTIYKPETVRLLNADGTLSRMTDIIFMFSTWVAEAEMSIKTERFARGRQRNKDLGKWNGGANGALYGYIVDSNGFIVPSAEESRNIVLIFNEYSTGKYSVRSLAKELKNRGIQLRGRVITDNNINNILSNSSYIGKNKAGIKYEAIISQELWDKVEAIRTGNDLGIRKSKESRYTHLAAKILKCKDCGGNYTANNDKYVCYRHSKPDRFEDDPCGNSDSIKVEAMDTIIWTVARDEEILARKRYNQASIPSLKERLEVLNQKIEQIDVRVEEIQTKKDRTVESYMDNKISKEIEESRLGKLTLERFQVEAERERYLYERLDIQDHIDDIMSGKPVDTSDLDQFTQLQKRELVEKHIKQATIEKTVEGGRKAIKVSVQVMRGKTVKYTYFFTLKDKAKQIKKG